MLIDYSRSIRILRVYQMLLKSSKNNPIMQKDIVEKLAKEYRISVDRKAVARDLEALTSTEDLFINKGSNGWYLNKERFEDYEVKILVDAIAAASFIDIKTTREVVAKLKELVSISSAKTIDKTIVLDAQIKAKDASINDYLTKIMKAIEANKKIQFKYFREEGGKKVYKHEEYQMVSPYYVVLTNNDYYLISNLDGRDFVTHYKLNRMEDVSIVDEPRRKVKDVPGMKEIDTTSKLGKYLREHPNFFSGDDVVQVNLICNSGSSDLVRKAFGVSSFFKRPDGTFSVTINIGNAQGFYYALASFGPDVEIASPKKIRDGYVEFIKATLARYE